MSDVTISNPAASAGGSVPDTVGLHLIMAEYDDYNGDYKRSFQLPGSSGLFRGVFLWGGEPSREQMSDKFNSVVRGPVHYHVKNGVCSILSDLQFCLVPARTMSQWSVLSILLGTVYVYTVLVPFNLLPVHTDGSGSYLLSNIPNVISWGRDCLHLQHVQEAQHRLVKAADGPAGETHCSRAAFTVIFICKGDDSITRYVAEHTISVHNLNRRQRYSITLEVIMAFKSQLASMGEFGKMLASCIHRQQPSYTTGGTAFTDEGFRSIKPLHTYFFVNVFSPKQSIPECEYYKFPKLNDLDSINLTNSGFTFGDGKYEGVPWTRIGSEIHYWLNMCGANYARINYYGEDYTITNNGPKIKLPISCPGDCWTARRLIKIYEDCLNMHEFIDNVISTVTLGYQFIERGYITLESAGVVNLGTVRALSSPRWEL